MSWTDEELDKLFRDAAGNAPAPEYKPDFFSDIEKQLPVQKQKRSLAWWWTANLFLVAFIGWSSVEIFKVIIPVGNQTLVRFEKKVFEKQSRRENLGKKAPVSKKNHPTLGNSTNDIAKEFKNEIPNTVNKTAIIKQNDDNSINQSNSTTEAKELELSQDIFSAEKEQLNDTWINKPLELNIKNIESKYTSANLSSGSLHNSKPNSRSGFLELNLGLEQSWTKIENESSNVYGTFGLNGGIIMRHGKFRISTGLGLSLTKFSDLKIKERSIIYGFGANTLENTYAFNAMFSVNAPIRIEFVSGRHAIEAGVTPTMNLLTAVHRYQHIDGNEVVSRSGYSGVRLFNSLGMKPTIGYSYFVKDNMQIGVRAGFQLLAPIQSDRFIGNSIRTPFEGQFFIRKELKSKN